MCSRLYQVYCYSTQKRFSLYRCLEQIKSPLKLCQAGAAIQLHTKWDNFLDQRSTFEGFTLQVGKWNVIHCGLLRSCLGLTKLKYAGLGYSQIAKYFISGYQYTCLIREQSVLKKHQGIFFLDSGHRNLNMSISRMYSASASKQVILLIKTRKNLGQLKRD